MSRSQSALNWLIVLVFAGTIPVVAIGARSLSSNSSDIAQWLPAQQEQRQQYDEFLALFGADDFLFVSWEGCTLDDRRLNSVKQAVLNAPETRQLVRRVTTGPELADLLIELEVEPDLALSRIEGILLSRDRQTTGILIQLNEEAKRDQYGAVLKLTDAALTGGLSRDQLRLGGSAYEAAMVEKESFESYSAYVPFIVVITTLLMMFSVRNFAMTGLILGVSMYCYFLAAAIVHYTGGRLNAVLIVLPVLVYVLVLSGCIHLANYYRDAVRQGGLRGAGRRALSAGWLPCAVANLTTAVGLASLGVSRIGPVRDFGLYSAAGLIASLAILLGVFPVLLELAGPYLASWRASGRLQALTQLASRSGVRVARTVLRAPNRVATIWILVVIVCGVGLLSLTTSVRLEDMFRPDSEILQNYRWMESTIGPLVPVEVLVHVDEQACELDGFDRIDLLDRIEQQLRSVDGVGGVISAVSFLPELPREEGIAATIGRSVLRKKLRTNRDRIVEQGFLADTPSGEVWRISARVPEMHEADYDVFVERVRQSVERTWEQWEREEIPLTGMRVSYTGLLPMMNIAQQQLLDDLMASLLLAVLLICPMMMVVLRSFVTGLLAMVPNIFPIVLVFGALTWLGREVNIGAMLTACVALGIAVDDTMHFLTWYRRSVDKGRGTTDAIWHAYAKCSQAMIQTTLVAGLGLLILVRSTYVPTSQFALLIVQLLFAALLGDLLLLPAILAGPAGPLFRGRAPADTGAERAAA